MITRVLLVALAALGLSGFEAKAQGYYEQPRGYEEDPSGGEDLQDNAPEGRDVFPGELHGLHLGCERGDRAACVKFGWALRDHLHDREQWRRRRPEYYWWDQEQR